MAPLLAFRGDRLNRHASLLPKMRRFAPADAAPRTELWDGGGFAPQADRVPISAEATAGLSKRLGVRRIEEGSELLDISISGRMTGKGVARRRVQVDLPEAARQDLQQRRVARGSFCPTIAIRKPRPATLCRRAGRGDATDANTDPRRSFRPDGATGPSATAREARATAARRSRADFDDHLRDDGMQMKMAMDVDVIEIEAGRAKGAELRLDLLAHLRPRRLARCEIQPEPDEVRTQSPPRVDQKRDFLPRQDGRASTSARCRPTRKLGQPRARARPRPRRAAPPTIRLAAVRMPCGSRARPPR